MPGTRTDRTLCGPSRCTPAALLHHTLHVLTFRISGTLSCCHEWAQSRSLDSQFHVSNDSKGMFCRCFMRALDRGCGQGDAKHKCAAWQPETIASELCIAVQACVFFCFFGVSQVTAKLGPSQCATLTPNKWVKRGPTSQFRNALVGPAASGIGSPSAIWSANDNKGCHLRNW